MLSKIKKYSKSLFWQLPVAGDYVKNKIIQKRYQVELALIEGRHRNENNHPSIIHFSVNKSATQYVKQLLKRCAAEKGMIHADIHDYAFSTGFPFLDLLSAVEMQKYQHLFFPTGYLYSVFGGMIEGIPELERYLIVLMVRDPRDVLVSSYYSLAYSHSTPYKSSGKYEKFMQERKLAQKSTIDEYVITESDRLCNIYRRYNELLLDKYPQVYLTRYEDMTSDFREWIKNLLNYCKLDINQQMLQSLIEKNKRLQPKKENIHKHLRKGKAGDYKEKLKPETVELLNSKLFTILKAFKYNIN